MRTVYVICLILGFGLVATMQNCGRFGAVGSSGASVSTAPGQAPQVAALNRSVIPSFTYSNMGFGCGITATGGVTCRGDNSFGQMGDGTYASSVSPIAITRVVNASAVQAVDYFSGAIVNGGHLIWWGDADTNGVFDSPTSDAGRLNALTSSISNALQITVRGDVLLADGSVINPYEKNSLTPVMTSITQVAASFDTLCGLRADGSITCRDGQGDFPSSQTTTAVEMTMFSPKAVQIAVGFSTMCALYADGHIECLGENPDGEAGTGDRVPSNSVTVRPALGGAASALVMGDYQGCAILSTGLVQCWGVLDAKDFDDDSVVPSKPTTIAGWHDVTRITPMGGNGSCAEIDGTSISCFGGEGRASGFESIYTASPAPVSQMWNEDGTYCAVDTAGKAGCWGPYNTVLDLSSVSGVTQMSTTYRGGCYTVGSSIHCFDSGVVDSVSRTATGTLYPVSNTGLACVILASNQSLQCWYVNGSGVVTSYTIPGPVIVNHSDALVCFATTAGDQKCFTPSTGAISSTIATGLNLTTSVQVALWSTGGCSLSSAGAVNCWGANLHGELGNGTHTASSTPVTVIASGVKSISSSEGLPNQTANGVVHVCAVMTDGTAKCWGDNENGNLGEKIRSSADVLVPTPFTDVSDIKSISLSTYGGSVLTNAGSVHSWGYLPSNEEAPGGFYSPKPW